MTNSPWAADASSAGAMTSGNWAMDDKISGFSRLVVSRMGLDQAADQVNRKRPHDPLTRTDDVFARSLSVRRRRNGAP
jgi:hypothetical protein